MYDGHAGHACADFLRDNLHQLVFNEYFQITQQGNK